MPITIKRKIKEESDELKAFKEEMLKAIKEVGVILENEKKAKKKSGVFIILRLITCYLYFITSSKDYSE